MRGFTIEENNIIAMYPHQNRREILEELHHAVLFIQETEMLELVQQTIDKIVQMSEEEFAQEGFDMAE